MIKMTEAYRAFSVISIILTLLAITTSNASAASLHSNLSFKTPAEMENYTDNFTPVYQGKCDRNPELPGC